MTNSDDDLEIETLQEIQDWSRSENYNPRKDGKKPRSAWVDLFLLAIVLAFIFLVTYWSVK